MPFDKVPASLRLLVWGETMGLDPLKASDTRVHRP
jgi:hypothetical protein